jgi:sigma-E factor negative regulatory protein RseA
MKDRISALIDGELDEHATGEALGQVGRDGEAGETWRTYHLIGDVLRDDRVLSSGFAARVGKRLAAEPTVLAPAAAVSRPRRWFPLPAAAAAAAVALVAWVAFAPQREEPQPQPQAAIAEVAKPPAIVMPSSAANDYLLAHQGFSPRVAFQGMAPYVRTVSDQVREDRR